MNTKFLDMIDHVKTFGFMNFTGAVHTPEMKENLKWCFFNMVERNNIFIFGGRNSETPHYMENPNLYSQETNFSSPFDVISLELSGKKEYLTITDPNDPDREGFNVGVLCYLYDDVHNWLFQYQYVTHDRGVPSKSPGFDGVGSYNVLALTPQISSLMYGSSLAVVGQYIDKINREKVATEVVNEKIKIRAKDGTNKFHKINKVIHVSPTKKYFSNLESTEKRKLDFSHRFFRRGHWRKYDPNFVGKDRHGERNQNGRSWVLESVVGDENLPLVTKVRVVNEIPSNS